MKTFETEKHNIPEGATHYSDEVCERYFSWFKFDGKEWFIMIWSDDDWVKCEHNEQEDSGVKPIPQTKEVGWENGLPPIGIECEYFHKPRQVWVKFIPLLITNKETSPNGIPAIYGEWYHPNDCMWEPDLIDLFDKPKFRKPETPEQRKEREELEAAYQLQSKCAVGGSMSFEVFKKNDCAVKFWKAIVKETGYRVEE